MRVNGNLKAKMLSVFIYRQTSSTFFRINAQIFLSAKNAAFVGVRASQRELIEKHFQAISFNLVNFIETESLLRLKFITILFVVFSFHSLFDKHIEKREAKQFNSKLRVTF